MAKRSKGNNDSQNSVLEPQSSLSSGNPGATEDAGGWRITALLLASVGFTISLVIIYVYVRLVSSGGSYTSFCSINATVNCDDVLASSYGKLLGVPVAIPAALDYILLIGLLLAGRRREGRPLAYAMLLTGWNLVFSLAMASISLFILHQLCLLCAGLYAVSLLTPGAAPCLSRWCSWWKIWPPYPAGRLCLSRRLPL